MRISVGSRPWDLGGGGGGGGPPNNFFRFGIKIRRGALPLIQHGQHNYGHNSSGISFSTPQNPHWLDSEKFCVGEAKIWQEGTTTTKFYLQGTLLQRYFSLQIAQWVYYSIQSKLCFEDTAFLFNALAVVAKKVSIKARRLESSIFD